MSMEMTTADVGWISREPLTDTSSSVDKLVDKLYKDPPPIQMAKFLAILGDEDRSVVRNLGIEPTPDDIADAIGLTPCRQLTRTIEALEKRFKTHHNVIYH